MQRISATLTARGYIASALLLLAFVFPNERCGAQIVGGAWETHSTIEGPEPGFGLGGATCGVGDLNGDGALDFVVGAPSADPGGMDNAGSVLVISGTDGSLIRRIDGQEPHGAFGFSVASAGDVNADGCVDVLIGAPGPDNAAHPLPGTAFVYSGADGRILYRFDGLNDFDAMGTSVAGLGDANLDGFSDVIVGAIGETYRSGAVYVFSGADGSVLHRFGGQTWGSLFGSSLAVAGDVDGDRWQDIIVGAYRSKLGGPSDSGSIYVYSGRSGAELFRFDGTELDARLGWSVAGIGDVNRDGLDDVATGAYFASPGGVDFAGSVFVLSGADGSQLRRIDGVARWDYFGRALSTAGDVDFDGCPDIIVGARGRDSNGVNAGSAYVFSGSDGSLLKELVGENAGDTFGAALWGGEDLDGDELPDLIIGSPLAGTNSMDRTGSVNVISFDPFLWMDSTELSTSGGTVAACMKFPLSESGRKYALLLSLGGVGSTSLNGVEIPLTYDILLGQMFGGWSPSILSGGFGTLNPQGRAEAFFRSDPSLAHYVGRTIYCAAVSYDPSGPTARMSSAAWNFVVTQ